MNDNHSASIPSSDALLSDFFTRRCGTKQSLSVTQKLDRMILVLIAAIAFTLGSPLCSALVKSESAETTAQVATPAAPLRPNSVPAPKSLPHKFFYAIARIYS